MFFMTSVKVNCLKVRIILVFKYRKKLLAGQINEDVRNVLERILSSSGFTVAVFQGVHFPLLAKTSRIFVKAGHEPAFWPGYVACSMRQARILHCVHYVHIVALSQGIASRLHPVPEITYGFYTPFYAEKKECGKTIKLHPLGKNTYIYWVHSGKDTYRSDQELIGNYHQDHNAQWLGILLERYFHLIFGVCMKYLKNETEAKDHTQQVCMKVLRELPHTEVHYFKSWLYQVTKNHCLMYLRKNKHTTLPLETTVDPESEKPPNKSEMLEKERQYDLLETAIDSLNAGQRSCVRLFYYNQKTYQEIADEKGYSLKQVKSFIQNGRRNIKLFMERNENG